MAGIVTRTDFEPCELRALAKSEKDARVARRLLAVAGALEGLSRADAARVGGMDRQTLRDWVIRFNTDGPDPDKGAFHQCRPNLSERPPRALIPARETIDSYGIPLGCD